MAKTPKSRDYGFFLIAHVGNLPREGVAMVNVRSDLLALIRQKAPPGQGLDNDRIQEILTIICQHPDGGNLALMSMMDFLHRAGAIG